jgi:magnesium transporter
MPKYQKISKNIQEIIISNPRFRGKIRWLNILNPGKEELEYLRRFKQYNFDFHELRASSANVQAERPMIERREKYFFFILQFPIFSGNRIEAGEVDFFISHELLITLHNGKISALNDFFNTVKKDEGSILAYKEVSAAILLYELLRKLVLGCYNLMDQNSAKINSAEKIIFSHEQKKAAAEMFELQRNIINIRRIIMNYKNILKKIMEMKSSIVSTSKLTSYYYNLIDHAKRIWEFSESQKETIQALHNTNESMLNFQINNIMKTLTIVSVIFAPLTFIVALLTISTDKGMPLLNTPNAFWIVASGLSALGLVMLFYFVRRKWL